MIRPSPARHRRGLAVATAVWCLSAPFASAVRGDVEPGPVPLLRDAAPAAEAPAAPRPTGPAGLGDWRLVAVLGLTLAVLVGVRMTASRRVAPLPPDVFEVLGTASLGGQQAVRIVRFGPKTLLVGVSSAGATTLAEIGDPQATECIVAACRGSHAGPRGAARSKPAARPLPAPPAGPAGEVG